MVAIDIKDKARRRTLFLHTAKFNVQDILDTLDDTGDDFETAAGKLAEYFQPKKNNLCNNSDKYNKSKMRPAMTMAQD